MSRDERLDAAADILARNRLEQLLFEGFPDKLRPVSQAEAYDVQTRVHERLVAAGEGQLVGHKIGCTTTVMQEFLGIDSPCAGRMLSRHVLEGEGLFPRRRTGRLGVECEVAVVLGAELGAGTGVATRADVARAVAACSAAIEVVEDRYVDYPALDTESLVADDFFHSGAVLGPPVRGFDPEALHHVTATMSIDGVEVGAGVGAAVMGHPLDALVWLSDNCSARGLTLRPGDVVLLGSLVQTHWVEPGARVEIHNDPLGTATAVFT